MLIYLNGTSSSGKTTIAIEVQRLIQKQILYFSIDSLLYALSKNDLESIMGKRKYDYPIDWDSIFSGYFSCVSALVQSGNDVVADCPVHNDKLASYFEKYIMPVEDKLIIKLECPLEKLRQREFERKDRAIGIAAKQYETIHKYLNYDLKVDTDSNSPSALAATILNRIPKSSFSSVRK